MVTRCPLLALIALLILPTGSYVTPATWMRNFVREHPDYKRDSVVSMEINYDLMKAVDEMYVPTISSRLNLS